MAATAATALATPAETQMIQMHSHMSQNMSKRMLMSQNYQKWALCTYTIL